MSISGDLLDVAVAEVMQFVHLGRRTGTLKVRSDDRQAEIGFHRGRIISAWTPQAERLGELLLKEGLIEQPVLEAMLQRQEQLHPRPSLGKLLVDEGILDEEAMRRVVGRQIEDTVYQLVSWKQGNFEFALDELRPIDDVGVYPGDILPEINLDTQMVVLDALRIFDEKNRSRLTADKVGPAAPAPPEPPGAPTDDVLADLLDEDDTQPEAAGPKREVVSPAAIRLQLLTTDDEFCQQLDQHLPPELATTTRVDGVDAGLTLPGEPAPVVLIDLRTEAHLEQLVSIARSRPRASILAVVDPRIESSDAYAAGALAVLPPDVEAIASCLRSLARARRSNGPEKPASGLVSSGFARLRRVVADLRSGLLSATVALNLMQVISESVERAILFLVQEDHLLALGAFGSDPGGQPLAQVTSGMTLPLSEAGALTDAINHGQTASMLFDEAELPEGLTSLIGRPRTGQVVIFPVLGSARVFSIVYADNGRLSREIEQIDILELAAAQVGVAFENEILRRRMERLRKS